MRRTLLFALLAVACDPIDYGRGRENEIVFGISQSAAGVEADYELIGLGGHGGGAAVAFRDGDGDGRCWYEDLDARLGKPHFDNGVARWTGGTLPAEGLVVQANQPESTKQATPGWTSSDALSFYVEGFAMPELDRVTMLAPLVELTIGTITPEPMALTPTTDVGVTWTPPVGENLSRVLVSLETEHANVRCFNRAEAGSSIVPAKWVAQLFPADGAPINGKLIIASHRQTTVLAPGNWVVYVVATAVHRDVAFTGTR